MMIRGKFRKDKEGPLMANGRRLMAGGISLLQRLREGAPLVFPCGL